VCIPLDPLSADFCNRYSTSRLTYHFTSPPNPFLPSSFPFPSTFPFPSLPLLFLPCPSFLSFPSFPFLSLSLSLSFPFPFLFSFPFLPLLFLSLPFPSPSDISRAGLSAAAGGAYQVPSAHIRWTSPLR
jgi:hypothetical protein